MASLVQALPWVLRHEGGWSNDPLDHGGATMMGITLETAQRHGIPDAEALKNISPEKVEAIYRSDYWFFDGIQDQRVATKVFDMAVNMGPRTAIRLLQRALNHACPGLDLAQDGVLGPHTLEAANQEEVEALLRELVAEALLYYHAIVNREPRQARFLEGWTKRAREVPGA